ncbi:transposase [Cytophagaceae bacterium ABcell3]|nr:transposase [Cytophagaceae bacterium ABcell3]WMJ75618.1 transposase [Cytophagaceae bacterium ABcell3]
MLRRHYKKKSSGFKQWEQKEHAEDYLVFPDNIGEHLSIDEVALSKGELYTFITNKNGRGKKGSLVASVKGTLSANIIQVLEKIPLEQRNKVKEVTLDMAKNMESSARTCFPMANLVTDRFHVVRLALEALQHIRVNQRWVELDMENKAIEAAKKNGVRYKAPLLPNGDTPKQLLARCRYVFAKKKADWTQSQEQRANIAFENYPDLKKAYDHVLGFRLIYESNTKISAEKKFAEWINKTHEMETKEFLTVANTVSNHMSNILNFFDNRSTNANAESFNSKIKLFRANLRGVVDTRFFLFRLSKLFA